MRTPVAVCNGGDVDGDLRRVGRHRSRFHNHRRADVVGCVELVEDVAHDGPSAAQADVGPSDVAAERAAVAQRRRAADPLLAGLRHHAVERPPGVAKGDGGVVGRQKGEDRKVVER